MPRLFCCFMLVLILMLAACRQEADLALPTRAQLPTSAGEAQAAPATDSHPSQTPQTQAPPTEPLPTEAFPTEAPPSENPSPGPTSTAPELSAVASGSPTPPPPSVSATHTLTATESASATLTQLPPSNTPTQTATATASATFSPTATLTASPSPEALSALVVTEALNVRNGPGDSFDVVAFVPQDRRLPVLGTSEEGDWLLVEYERGLRGWLAARFVELNGDLASAPNLEPTPLPDFVRLDGIRYLRQRFNNCSPTALTMALTYFGGTDDQMVAAAFLRPDEDDVSVDISEMVRYANEQMPGVRAVWRMGGSWNTLRRLVAAGFPVIIETSVQVRGQGAGWAGHNRVVVGYDGDSILTYDSYLGNGQGEGLPIEQSVLDELWRHMNRNFMVMYPAERETEVAYILGEDWSIAGNIEKAYRVALAELAANPNNAFAAYNLGTAYVAKGMYSEAVEMYDLAFDIGLPFRIHWYQFGLFEAYYQAGEYGIVIDVARRTLDNMGGMATEELYYWLGLGYAGRGQVDAAIRQMQNAVAFNPNYQAAQEMLALLEAGNYEAPVLQD